MFAHLWFRHLGDGLEGESIRGSSVIEKSTFFHVKGEGEGRMSLMEQYFLHYIVILSSEEGEVLLDFVIPFNGCHFS